MSESPIILNKFLGGMINTPRLEAAKIQQLIEVLPKPITHPIVNLKILFKDFVRKACLKRNELTIGLRAQLAMASQ